MALPFILPPSFLDFNHVLNVAQDRRALSVIRFAAPRETLAEEKKGNNWNKRRKKERRKEGRDDVNEVAMEGSFAAK